MNTGGWMGASGARIGLGEAFQRTDENGRYIPRPRPGSKEGVVSDSRIPRARTFSPSLSPERVEGQASIGSRQVRSRTAPLDSESDTGTRDGSPSPAPKGHYRNNDGSGSSASQLSLVEDPTMDDFDRKMSQHAKDQARIKNIMSSQKGLFARGDIGPKVAETTRTLARKSSASSFEAEPPVHPPTNWGSKARKSDGWIREILSPQNTLEIKNTPEAQAPAGRRAGADVALASVEDISLSQNPTPPASRPTSAQPNNASPEKSQFWNADDFTAQSLQMNTSPLLRVRNTKLEEIRDREIQSLTARAIASNKLKEIQERNSEDRSFNSEGVKTDSEKLQTKDVQAPDQQAEEQLNEMTILEEEGERIRGTPITVFTRSAYESQSRSDSSSRERSKGGSGRYRHSRDDSRELLRKLSRAASNSPVPSIPEKDVRREDGQIEDLKILKSEAVDPGKPIPVETGSAEIRVADNKSERVNGRRPESSLRNHTLNPDAKRYSRSSTPPKSDVDPEERIDAEARLFDLQDNKSERNSVKGRSRSPSPPSEDGQLDETPRAKIKVDPLSLPTPKVTGAYVETPSQTVSKPRKSRSFSPHYEAVNVIDTGSSSNVKKAQESTGETNHGPADNRPRRGLRRTSSHRELVPSRRSSTSRPPLINTAKPISVADDLRRIQQEAQIEDSTLDDFDALLTAEAAASANPHDSTTIFEPVIDLEYDERGNPLSEKAIERRLERIHLERMSQSIKSTSSSIRAARHGIERLEEQVSSSIPSARVSEDAVYIKIPVPRLWVSQPPREPGMRPSWKFTRLGFILAIFLAWYLSESAMCSQFCHPENSRYNTWQPSDPFFPWAIPTKLDQWTGSVASTTATKVWYALGGWTPSPRRYHGGPLGANDWWLGRDGPVGLVFDDENDFGSIFMDETID